MPHFLKMLKFALQIKILSDKKIQFELFYFRRYVAHKKLEVEAQKQPCPFSSLQQKNSNAKSG